MAAVLALIGVLAIGEVLTHIGSPADVRPYDEASAPPGPFLPDPIVRVAYSSLGSLRGTSLERFAELDTPSVRPVWLLLGNSFVQAPGMLGDTAAANLPGRLMFYLGRNEILPVRVAQSETLLAGGLKPERIIFALVPVDLLQLGRRSLDQVGVARNGGLFTLMVRPESALARLLDVSGLARTIWIRSGHADRDPGFQQSTIHQRPSTRVTADLECLLGRLADLSRRYRVPVTILLIPSHDQITGRAGLAMQDAVGAMARRLSLDVYDSRNVFAGLSTAETLFLADWHFSARGNELLYTGLIRHLAAAGLPNLPRLDADDVR